MNGETLRKAAALMRERAGSARAGRWSADGPHVRANWQSEPRNVALCGGSVPGGNELNAEHIASWHPAVALAVADWLDTAAWFMDAAGTVDDEALAVARAYLGDDA